jgi:hypothetical protein
LPNQTPETTPETEEPEVPQIDFRTNPFIMVDHDPFSISAADVDTANYDIFRQYVSELWTASSGGSRSSGRVCELLPL